MAAAPVRQADRTWRDDVEAEPPYRRGADAEDGRRRPARARPARRAWRPAPWMLQLAAAALLLALLLTLATLPPPAGPAVRRAVGRALDADLDVARAIAWVRDSDLRGQAARLVGGVLQPVTEEEPRWIWPVRGTLAAPYGWRQAAGGQQRFHEGVDIAAPEGTPVVAAAAGTVRRVERDPQLGLYVEIEHAGGWVSRYAQLESAGVLPRDRVLQGQVIGRVGRGGEGGPHLHFELRVARDGAERAVDPEPKLRRAGGP